MCRATSARIEAPALMLDPVVRARTAPQPGKSELGSSYTESSTKGLKSTWQVTSLDWYWQWIFSFSTALLSWRSRQSAGSSEWGWTGLLKVRFHQRAEGLRMVLLSDASENALPSPFRVFEETKKQRFWRILKSIALGLFEKACK